jgi:hypothetical protein
MSHTLVVPVSTYGNVSNERRRKKQGKTKSPMDGYTQMGKKREGRRGAPPKKSDKAGRPMQFRCAICCAMPALMYHDEIMSSLKPALKLLSGTRDL